MRMLGLDVGDKTIGVAVSDLTNLIASGVTTIQRVGARKDAGKVMDYIREYEVGTVVIGLPLKLDGTESPQTLKVRAFAELLANKLRSSGAAMSQVKLVFQDESLSTVTAEEVLIMANMQRKKRREIIDRQAAIVILQSYLDEQPRP
ncbi:MAG: Holliday junction resolvase RuvX [Clostridiales bacterium]|nr:Holliday junction resolvase RuvX [Clostridiales bacterium]MBQ3107039.1 Holliday junction resolvase RuvX [Bacillota bacterium]